VNNPCSGSLTQNPNACRLRIISPEQATFPGVAEIETAIPALSPVQAPPYLESAKHPLRGKNAQQRQIADFQRHGATFERDRLLKIGQVYRIMAGKNRTF